MAPSPKSQLYEVALEEELVKVTVKPSVTDEKFAVGTDDGMGGRLASSW